MGFIGNVLVLGAFLYAGSALGAIPGDASLSAPFYRDPRSPVPSGSANRRALSLNQVSEKIELAYQTVINGEKVWVPSSAVTRDWQVSYLGVRKTDSKIYEIESLAGSQASLRPIAGGSNISVSVEEITPSFDDKGSAVTLIETSIKAKPQWKSDTLTTVPAQTRLRILDWVDHEGMPWLEILTLPDRQRGFIEMSSALTKADFATHVFNQDKWIPVRHRNGLFMVTGDDKKISLLQIKGWMTDPSLGIVHRRLERQNLLVGQRITLDQTAFQNWRVSQLQGHGLVYWKEPKAPEIETQSSDQLVKKNIFSQAFHPQNSKTGLASAQGIWMTSDGLNWNRLPQFGQQNWPVLVSAKGDLIVGPFQSRNQGESFRAFLRWDVITEAIQKKEKRPPRQIRLSKMDWNKKGQLEITLETGFGRHKLVSSGSDPLTSSWDLH